MNIKTIVGDNIRELRYKLNVSQEKLAEYADLHRNYIGMVERAEVNITVESLTQIAKALHVPPGRLLDKDFYRDFEYHKTPPVKKRWSRS
jgi:transcriptional regulator with XRE-family HTH domain